MSKRLQISTFIVALIPYLAQAAKVSFVPVRGSGTHQVLAPSTIYLPQGGQRLILEFFVSDWDPDGDGSPELWTAQIAVNLGSYANPNSPNPLAFPDHSCTNNAQCASAYGVPSGPRCEGGKCQALFIDTTRPDYAPAGLGYIAATDSNSSGSRIGFTINDENGIVDVGTPKYFGSLALDVPVDAIGEFTLTLRPFESFLLDDSSPPNNHIPVTLIPAKVFVGVPPTVDFSIKPRYFSFTESEPSTTLRGYAVRLTSLHNPSRGTPASLYQPADFSGFEGQVRWLGAPIEFPMSEAFPQHTFFASQMQCNSHFRTDWPSDLLVFGPEVIPDSIYEVKGGFAPSCTNFNTCGYAVGTFTTGRWADAVPPFEVDLPGSQPDIADISALVSRFRNEFGAPTKAQVQLQPNLPDPSRKVNFADIANAVDAFRGQAYPYAGPTACP